MAEFGNIRYIDFTILTSEERESAIKKWARQELERYAGTQKYNHMMSDVRLGHEGKHYDESKQVNARNFDELTDYLFSDNPQEDVYLMTAEETSHVVERAVKEMRNVSTFIDAGRATYSFITAIHDGAGAIGDWLVFGKEANKDIDVDFDGVYCGSGILRQPIGYEIGKMFPEMSTMVGKVIMQKDRFSDYFFKAYTAFPDIVHNGEPTGRYLDKEIEKALQSDDISRIAKSYWNLALSGYRLELTEDKSEIRCNFQHQGKLYTVKIKEDSWMYPMPYVRAQDENGKFKKFQIWQLPKAVADEAEKIHRIANQHTRELSNIRNGILKEDHELQNNVQSRNEEDVLKD